MAVLLNTRYQPVWLARADIFGKHQFLDTFLKFIKIIPVYRLRDGKENLNKNLETFSVSIKVLENNFALALFPEAAHSFRRQMMPHKKAVPRIVFMAEEQTGNKLDIQIIPTGIFYSSYWKFNRTLIVNFGNPIPVNHYLKTFGQNMNLATAALRKDLYDAILPLIINIKSKKLYEGFERIRELYGEYFLQRQGKKVSPLNHFKSDQLLATMLDELETKHPHEAEQVVSMADEYYHLIRFLGLRSRIVSEKGSMLLKITGNLILLLLGFPFFVYGLVFNAPPFFLIDRFVREKVKDKAFWSSFFLVAGIVIFPIYYLLLAIAVFLMIPSILYTLCLIISLPFAGKLAFNWYILLRKTIGLVRFQILKGVKKDTYQQLLNQRNRLFEKLDTMLPLLQEPEQI
jgi:hypothetical protein